MVVSLRIYPRDAVLVPDFAVVEGVPSPVAAQASEQGTRAQDRTVSRRCAHAKAAVCVFKSFCAHMFKTSTCGLSSVAGSGHSPEAASDAAGSTRGETCPTRQAAGCPRRCQKGFPPPVCGRSAATGPIVRGPDVSLSLISAPAQPPPPSPSTQPHSLGLGLSPSPSPIPDPGTGSGPRRGRAYG